MLGGRDWNEGTDNYLHRGLLLRNSGGCFNVEEIHIAGVWRLRDIRSNFNIGNTKVLHWKYGKYDYP